MALRRPIRAFIPTCRLLFVCFKSSLHLSNGFLRTMKLNQLLAFV